MLNAPRFYMSPNNLTVEENLITLSSKQKPDMIAYQKIC